MRIRTTLTLSLKSAATMFSRLFASLRHFFALSKEKMWIPILLILAILAIVLFRPREHMTNKDLMDTLKTFGEKGTKPKTKDVHQESIYGPRTTKVEEPKPSSSSKKGSDDDTNVYPDIYGPEITPIPGSKSCKKGKHESDCVDNEAYQFNPDFANAFPREENEPQPFLTDFSKFQH